MIYTRALQPNRPSRRRKLLMVIAWLVFIGSLAAPAIPDTFVPALFIPGINYTPVAFVIGYGAFSCIRLMPSPYMLVLPPTALFVLMPSLIGNGPGRRGAAALRWVSLGLLSVWAFPLVCTLVLSAQNRNEFLCGRVLWGYYLFGLAHMLAAVAIWVGPPPRSFSRRRGFSVVVDNKNNRMP